MRGSPSSSPSVRTAIRWSFGERQVFRHRQFLHDFSHAAIAYTFLRNVCAHSWAVHEDAATKVRLELVKHEGGQFAASCFQVGQERRPVFLYRSVEQSCFWAMAFVCARDRVGVTACCWLRGKHQLELSATGRVVASKTRDSSARPIPAARILRSASCCWP